MSEEMNIKALERRIKQHIKAREHGFFAIVQPGFESTALGELRELGIGSGHEITEGGISFTGRMTDCQRCNIMSHTVSRLLMRLDTFRAENFHRFHERMAKIPWELHISDGQKIRFALSARKSRLYHTGRLEEECAGAVSRRLAEYGLSALLGEKSPDEQMVFVRLEKDICTVSLDSSGELLYRRGKKRFVTEAPLRETLASLILREASLRDYDMLMDPMCGSGTFSLEAAALSRGMAPGIDRDFSFMKWPVFSEAAWRYTKNDIAAELKNTSWPLSLLASDNNAGALRVAGENIAAAGFADIISCERRDFFADIIEIPEGKRCLIVMNPPYGGRLKIADTASLYRRIGDTIRRYYGRCGYAVIVPGLDAEKAMGLSHDRKITFMNGGIPVAVLFRDALR
jgi:putative N6-adenine-specific DNA methylase